MAKFTESFDQPDSTTLGPDLTWTEVAGDWETINGQAALEQASVNAYVRAEGDTGSADMYVEAVLPVESVFSANYTDHQILARMDATAHTGYALLRGYGAVEGQFVSLRRYQAGSVTELTSRITLPADLPETLRLEVEGSTITAYRNGVQVASVTDSAITTGGYGGLGGYRSSDKNAVQSIRFDSFETGALGAEPGPLLVDAGADQSIYVGQTASVSASASGGTAPYSYAWSKVSGPTGSFLNANQAATTFDPSGGAGTYVLRCTVTDAASAVAQDDLTLNVSESGATYPGMVYRKVGGVLVEQEFILTV